MVFVGTHEDRRRHRDLLCSFIASRDVPEQSPESGVSVSVGHGRLDQGQRRIITQFKLAGGALTLERCGRVSTARSSATNYDGENG